jgi:hypothetical protein
MRRGLHWSGVVMCSLSLVVACGSSSNSGNAAGTGGGAGSSNGTGGGFTMHPDFMGPSAAHTIGGIATEIVHGARIPGAAVTVVGGTQTATTDAKGEFILNGLPEGSVSVSVTKDGYAPGYGIADSASDARAVLVTLKKEGEPQTYDATQAGTLVERTDNGPYAVIFEPNTLDTTDTNLRVSVTPLDPTVEGAALPGDLIAGGASPSPLDSVTFAEFSILDSAGNHVNLKATASAIVELPIPLALRGTYPVGSKIHCYAYNPGTGKWEDFVEGTVALSTVDMMTPVLRASIRHFSWYGGAPDIQDQACVLVQVISNYTGKPLAGAVVTARPGLKAVTDANGVALITVKKDSKVDYVATKTYTDTYVDANGNLIAQAGSKVIEMGRVETDDTLVPLTTGPCAGTESTSDTSKAVRVTTGPIGNGDFSYSIEAIVNSGETAVIINRGIPDMDGNLIDPEAASGAIIQVRTDSGTMVVLQEIAAGAGFYTTPGMQLPAAGGERYTISVDADGNGSVDATASCVVPGTLAWVSPTDGGSYGSADFVASWTDTLTGHANYSPQYVVLFEGTTDTTSGGVYAGGALSYRPDPPLAAGTYTGVLEQQFTSSGFAGVGVDGELLCGATTQTPDITFTIR